METRQKKMFFIYNPHSGKAQIKNKISEIIDLFVKNHYEVTVHPTQEREDALHMVEQKSGEYDMIVFSGGDGTVNEVVSGLMKTGRRPVLGYIPSGTVNDFAASLHIPRDLRKAAHLIVEGMPFDCDIGGFNDKYFSYVAAFGIFTDVAYQTPQHFKNILGKTAYVLEGAKQLYNLKSYHMTVCYQDKVLEDDFIFGLITNSTSVGGFKGYRGKGVKLDDGEFEVSLIKAPKNPIEMQIIISALLQKEINQDFITTFRASELKIVCDEEVSWTLDGEFGGSYTEVSIQNHCRAIRIMTDPIKMIESLMEAESEEG